MPKGTDGAMLIQSVRRMGAKIDDEFGVWQKGEPNIHLIDTPYQHLADLLMEAACRARTVADQRHQRRQMLCSRRSTAKVTNIGKKKLDAEEKGTTPDAPNGRRICQG